jgi:hypothetical protein
MNYRFLILIAALVVLTSSSLFAQGERKDKTAVTYEEIYDEPYSVNKLFIGLIPMYGELFVTNVNAGYGADAIYYLKDKADFRFQLRKTYSQKFYDFSRELASSQSSVDNRAEIYNYYELGGSYHFKDFEESSKTKMFLYKNSYKGNKWAARVPLHAEVPCKVRKIYAARLGGIFWNSTADLGRIMDRQGLVNSDLLNISANASEIPSLPDVETIKVNNQLKTNQPVHPFTNISSTGLYVGGSMSWIRNVAVNFDKFEEGIDDGIFTTYIDILIAPSLKIDDVVYTPKDDQGVRDTGKTATYSVSPVKTKTIGFRAGIDGRFNRTLSWSYGGEVGYRPSFDKSGFYVLLKIAFPVFGTNLDYKVESFGK